MEINHIFSCFLATDFLEDIDNEELKKYALTIRESTPGVIKSNFLGWQSDILQIPNPQVSLLVDSILKKSDSLKSRLGFKEEYYFYLNNLWININQKSSFNRPHIHPDCLLAGVYYIDCNETQGKIVFRNPSMVQQCIIDEDSISKFTEFNSSSWSATPETGKLMIFPSWLEHYVEPNITDQERISIAFNISIKKE
jgi:uncharacterized protein (TIGR02466 family)